MKLKTHIIPLQMRHTFTIALGSQDAIDTFVVELIDGDVHGYGESQAIDYYGVNAQGMQAAVEAVRDHIEGATWDEPTELWHLLQEHLGDNPFAMCAIDQAAHDLWGKRLGHPVHALWGLDTNHNVRSDYTIGIDSIEKMIEKMAEFPDWPIYKIKLGTDRDIEIVQALRQHTDAVFRIDANTAWSASQTIENSIALKELGVEFLEQPLPADAWDDMAEVYAHSALPVIADESCIVESDVDHCHGFFHGVNVKLTKCGGLTPGRRMILRAKELGLQTMVGCMTESSIGISAIAQLAPLLDYVDMDGAVLIANDIAKGITLDRGEIIYPETAGNGISVDW